MSHPINIPSFYSILSQPSKNATLPPKPTELNSSQNQIYQNILNELRNPELKLPQTFSEHDSLKKSPLNEIEKCYCTKEFILRICRANSWNPTLSLKRVLDTIIWRREYNINEIDLDLISKEAESGKQFVLGYDLHSRPCLHMYPYKQNTKPSDAQIKFVVWCLERTIDLMPPGIESLTLLIDFGNSKNNHNSTGQPTTLSQAKQVLNILQTYYCERLGRAICINVPWLFWGFYKLVKPFIDPRTVEKIKFNPDVTELVPSEQLEKNCFGGQLEFQYEHEIYFPLLIKLCNERRTEMLKRFKKLGSQVGLSEYDLRGGNDINGPTETENVRPIHKRHAETDTGDTVISQEPPRSDESLELPKFNKSLEPPRFIQSLEPPRPLESLQPSRPDGSLDPPRSDGSLEPPRSDESLELPRSDESLTPSQLPIPKNSLKKRLSSSFKNHFVHKHSNKAIDAGVKVIKAESTGLPLNESNGASRNVQHVLRQSFVK
ncbi:hypothetical protein CROQUDRAFT_652854 [Cronartium quercuum f. sp. fusiforme G11]|uniref:CRAL-TRIO domain-containing protein n=1 Tax=Cronartium quercuum f. sp. fusiforme G11 TaxID=708437 RepID=A0A9P6NTL1_9BASI|nr:hypothetical protein CROQUDRAFT_652854 [Cronartium quercuum f. sp. fusiforme G11]